MSTCFSVVDLANAFFTIPVQKDSQYPFKGKTWIDLSMGFCKSPATYNAALRDQLESILSRRKRVIVVCG